MILAMNSSMQIDGKIGPNDYKSWCGENYIVGDAKIKGLMCVLLGARAQCLVGS